MRAVSQPLRFAVGSSALGAVLVAEGTRGLSAVLLGDEPEPLVVELTYRYRDVERADGELAPILARVLAIIAEPRRELAFPLQLGGTDFQKRVWRALLAIPCGETRSYAEVASAIGAPLAVRAVARACASNPLAVVVPCHRVVRSNGELSGYRWGVARKRWLLERERSSAGARRPVGRTRDRHRDAPAKMVSGCSDDASARAPAGSRVVCRRY